jgi:hypothetical protein
MATPSYKERMRAARAEASAKRKARESAEQLARNTMTEARRLALQAVIAGIKARGDKPQLYSRGSLVAMANQSISPFLVAQARLNLIGRACAPQTQAPLAQAVDPPYECRLPSKS